MAEIKTKPHGTNFVSYFLSSYILRSNVTYIICTRNVDHKRAYVERKEIEEHQEVQKGMGSGSQPVPGQNII
jgi:hypothetical protein